jgi:putative DNA primase/helicase
MTLETLAARFRGPVRRDPRGLHVFCPCHEDGAKRGKPSLRLWENPRTGWLNLKCWAGCSTDDVLRMRGLTPDDLRPQRSDRSRSVMVADYEYRDERGTLIRGVERHEPKAFRQWRPDPARSGKKLYNVSGVRRVLYRLPELQGARLVFIPEGEKCVEALRALGLVATCNLGGAGKWRDDYTTQLVAAGVTEVIVLPDNDPPGEAHAAEVARSCRAAGLRVVVLRLTTS